MGASVAGVKHGEQPLIPEGVLRDACEWLERTPSMRDGDRIGWNLVGVPAFALRRPATSCRAGDQRRGDAQTADDRQARMPTGRHARA